MTIAIVVLLLFSLAVAVTFGRMAAGRKRHDVAAYVEHLRRMRGDE